MKVTLVEHTPRPDRLVAASAGQCYSPRSAPDLLESMGDEKIAKRLRGCIARGHHSVLEHAVFTFSLEGISRVTSHQLVRHRIASYSQQSQRYVRLTGAEEYIVPPSIAENERLRCRFKELCASAAEFYGVCTEAGIPAQDARYIIPSGVSTKIVVTMNARQLRHFFSIRCCMRSQWEIRKVAWLMLRRARQAAPLLFEKAGPSCMAGPCPEGDGECFEKMSAVRRQS
jgi:thymidylate synthase (FAD)